MQQHVSTRTSTQARSHAQKFFVKLDKKSLTLEEFLKDLDLKEVEKTLLASGMDNTDYDEEREVNMVANRKLRGSVMNIALPANSEEKKQEAARSEAGKRRRSELEGYGRSEGSREQSINNIRKAFEQHANDGSNSCNQRVIKRVKTSERGEKGYNHHPDKEERPCSEITTATGVSKLKLKEDHEATIRKLSLSDFEPIQPSPMIKAKSTFNKEALPFYGTPQPNNPGYFEDYHITPDQLFRKPRQIDHYQDGQEAQAGDERRQEKPHNGRSEARLSFDFYELSADQLLESTPISFYAQNRGTFRHGKQ